jgi:hypothetical protein
VRLNATMRKKSAENFLGIGSSVVMISCPTRIPNACADR